MVVYKVGLILSVKSKKSTALKCMDTLAHKIASKFGGVYDGHGIGVIGGPYAGEIDEFIYFRNSDAARKASRGILPIMSTIEGCPKSIRYTISNPNSDKRDPVKRVGNTRRK